MAVFGNWAFLDYGSPCTVHGLLIGAPVNRCRHRRWRAQRPGFHPMCCQLARLTQRVLGTLFKGVRPVCCSVHDGKCRRSLGCCLFTRQKGPVVVWKLSAQRHINVAAKFSSHSADLVRSGLTPFYLCGNYLIISKHVFLKQPWRCSLCLPDAQSCPRCLNIDSK